MNSIFTKILTVSLFYFNPHFLNFSTDIKYGSNKKILQIKWRDLNYLIRLRDKDLQSILLQKK